MRVNDPGPVRMASKGAGCLLQELPDDVLALLSGAMQHRDLFNLSFTCKKFRSLCDSDKLWMPHCKRIVESWAVDLTAWRTTMASCKALFRFLYSVRSLVGIWVHQNPELGNMVYVTWGFVSVVACRIIPQELGSRGLDKGLLWAPVFEIIGHCDGSLAFFLHGRECEKDYCYPGRFKAAKEDPNVLLLEAEPLTHYVGSPDTPNSPLVAMADHGDDSSREELKATPKASKGKIKAAPTDPVPFHRLAFGDRRRLLEVLAPQVRLKVLQAASGPLFPVARDNLHCGKLQTITSNDIHKKELLLMSERRSLLMCMYTNATQPGSQCKGVYSADLLKKLCSPLESSDASKTGDESKTVDSTHKGKTPSSSATVDSTLKGKTASISAPALPASDLKGQSDSLKKLGFARFVRAKMKQILSKNTVQDCGKGGAASNAEIKRLQLQEFLKQGDAIGLRLHATSWKLNFYRAWPIMHDNRFALYKIPEQKPEEGREHAGLWGGTFGWPPGQPAEDKPGKALFFLLLSYDETVEGRLLIATKILEGTHYVLHPNGSAMFTAKINEPSAEQFPWETNKDGAAVDIVQTFQGEGIANGYGFRYPGSKPGDLFVDSNGVMAFVWRESGAVLTLQRLDLQSLLERGERVAALPPIANFAYLTKSYSNVFAGYCGHMSMAARAKSNDT